MKWRVKYDAHSSSDSRNSETPINDTCESHMLGTEEPPSFRFQTVYEMISFWVGKQPNCGNNSSENAAQNDSSGGNNQLSTASTVTNDSTDDSKLSSMFGSSTISLSSDSSVVSVSESEVCVAAWSNFDMEAAAVAAAWMSRGEHVSGRGSRPAIFGKFRIADWPLMVSAATSWARAAISGVAKVPSQMRDFFRGSRISETHLPQLRFRTPWYTGCLLHSLGLLARAWTFEPESEDGDDVEEVVSDEVVVCVIVDTQEWEWMFRYIHTYIHIYKYIYFYIKSKTLTYSIGEWSGMRAHHRWRNPFVGNHTLSPTATLDLPHISLFFSMFLIIHHKYHPTSHAKLRYINFNNSLLCYSTLIITILFFFFSLTKIVLCFT